ncbi:Epoxide hydrolase 3 [Datura stramonium]|uniref:Epoxide hydrolase 3 n=1 Tax=Datura stramonium TaxID=4076 RepID=A0ABS8SQB3_DATST|nr:Epoxide hydrolase 3 [Datura stramonium]
MEKVQHKNVSVNGIKMHVAEIGEGPAVLFVHGFPELWYSWRHQMLYFSSKGYRAIAPDLRGYGDTDCPPEITSYIAFHIVGDLVALLDVLGLEQVFLVGHDWGATIAWYFCLFRPDRIKALVNLSVVFRPRHPLRKPVDILREFLGDDYYICRFQKPGEVEEEFASIDTEKVVKGFLSSRGTRPPCIPKEIGFHQAFAQSPATLPSWLTEEDVHYYAEKFKKTGFTGGLNYYRNLDKNWELTAPFSGCKIQVPTKFVVGDLDLTYHIPGTKEYIHNGGFKKEVLNLQEVVVMEGVGHFTNQEKPDEISAHIYDFIQRF